MFGSSTKKRTRDNETQEDLADASMDPSQRRNRLKVSSPTSKEPATNAFVEQKRGLWQQHIEGLNEDTQAKLLEPSNTHEDMLHIAAEHNRQASIVEDLYHRTPGNVVAMGMDDVFQLGIAKASDAEKDTEYAPTLIRNIPDEQGFNIIQVAAGGLHSAGLAEDGSTYTWGCNDDSSLGRDGITEETEHKIEQIDERYLDPEDRGKTVGIAAGDSHTLMLSLLGNVYQTGMYKVRKDYSSSIVYTR